MRPIDADALQTALVDEYSGISGHKTREKFYRAIEIVRRQPTIALPPNDPLTIEELREMDGEPVWVYNSYNGWCNCRVVECIKPEDVFFTDGTARRISSYGDGWLAYRRRPEEGT